MVFFGSQDSQNKEKTRYLCRLKKTLQILIGKDILEILFYQDSLERNRSQIIGNILFLSTDI